MFFQRLRPGFSALTVGQDRLALGLGRAAPRRRGAWPPGPRSRWAWASACAFRCASTLARLACSRASSASAGARLIISGGLVVGSDRGDQVAGGVLADPLVLVAHQPVEDLDLGPDPAGRVGLDQLLGRLGRDPARLERLDQLRGLLRASPASSTAAALRLGSG